MALNVIDPFAEIGRLRQQMDEMRRRFFNAPGHPLFCPPILKPAVDICQTEDSVVVIVEVPGVDLESLSIHLEGQTLTVRGQKCDTSLQSSGRTFTQMEIACGMFERSVRLPNVTVNIDSAKANYRDGFLEISLPIVQKPATRRIPVDPQ